VQNQARSTNLDSAIEWSIAIDVLVTPGIVYCVTSSSPHATRLTLNMHRSNKEHANAWKIRTYIHGDSGGYTPHGASTFALMKPKRIWHTHEWRHFKSSDKRYTGKASESTAIKITCHDHSMLYWDARDVILSQLAQVFICGDYRAEPCNGPIAITPSWLL